MVALMERHKVVIIVYIVFLHMDLFQEPKCFISLDKHEYDKMIEEKDAELSDKRMREAEVNASKALLVIIAPFYDLT